MPAVRKKQVKPAGGREEQAFLAILCAANWLAGKSAEMLKRHGLSPTQYNALRILRGAGTEGLPCSQIGDRMIKREPDITRLLNRMQRAGMVTRSRDPKDRRMIMARITPAGLDLLQVLDRPVEEFHRATLGHMGKTKLHSLIRLLKEAGIGG